MAWVDYGKAFDLVPHSWIIECPDLLRTADNMLQSVYNRKHGRLEGKFNIIGLDWGKLEFEEASFKLIVCHHYSVCNLHYHG